ncbi:MAG: CPBP family intramembrane metalloprotease [Pseudomonadota bacterium]|nr:CPBP family intramembrane metalloprotease [Pseudomonadota bacterium]
MMADEMMMDERRRLVTLAVIGLLLAFGLPELGLTKMLFADTPVGERSGREIVWIAFAVLMLLWVTLVERLPLSSIGIRRPSWGTLGWGIAATVALMATAMLSFAVIAPALGFRQNMAATAAITQVPLWLMITTAIVAGISEEILYRGYAIERLEFLTGNRWIAGFVAAAAFLILHVAWGGTQMIVVAFGTTIFVGLYLWRRDLPCVMIAHILADMIGFTLARVQT